MPSKGLALPREAQQLPIRSNVFCNQIDDPIDITTREAIVDKYNLVPCSIGSLKGIGKGSYRLGCSHAEDGGRDEEVAHKGKKAGEDYG